MDLLVNQTHQPVLLHKTLDSRYPRYSPDLDGSQGGGISDHPRLWNNNSNDHYIAMSAFHTEGESDHSDLSEDQLVENLVACMICRVVDETLGFSGSAESALGLPLAPPPGPLRELQRESEARTQENR